MGKKICQNKNRHLAKIINNLDEMRDRGDHCDFTIKVGSVKYRAHKNILSAGSEYFKAMFRHDMKENQLGEVDMKDVDSECLKICIDFIYTGELELPDGKNYELLHASQMLQLDDVRNAVTDELENNLNVKNFYSTKKNANFFNLKSLFIKCKEFEKKNIIAISRQPEFQEEKKVGILEILKSYELLLSEKQKLDIAINWIGGRAEKKEDFLEILSLIDLTDVPPDYIKYLIEKDPLISNDFKLYKTFNDTRTTIMERCLAAMEESKIGKKDDKTKLDDRQALMFFNLEADCLEMFDPKTNEAKMLDRTNFRHFCNKIWRSSFTAISLNSFIYIMSCKSIHRLNVKDLKPQWMKMPDMIEDHGKIPIAVTALGFVFVIGGGYKGSKNTEHVIERFDPVGEQWSRLIDAPSPLCYHAVVSLNESIYCLGGMIDNKSSNAFFAFNVASLQWANLPSIKNAKQSCCAVTENQKIFALGGFRYNQWLNEFECFDTMTLQWITMLPMSDTVTCPCACLIDDWIFIGRRGSQANELLMYDVENRRWQRMTGFPSFNSLYFVSI